MDKILIVDDDPDISKLLKKFLEKNQFETFCVDRGDAAIKHIKKHKVDLVLCDYRLPDTAGIDLLKEIKAYNREIEVIMITGYSDVRVAVNALKLGALDYVTKPLYPDEILLTINSALKNNKRSSPVTVMDRFDQKYVIGESEQSRNVEKLIDLVAPTDMTVIIEGETGTGKEYVAKAIHSRSKRNGKPFVAIDCGAISNDLAGSELFGHIKGSFTGAVSDKLGSFEMANGGSLFLDEIGNLSQENQVKLLRVLQERKIVKIGSVAEVPIDVRIIVATNEGLKNAVDDNKFRSDIYHRLNEFKIELTPLRGRKPDIRLYSYYFLNKANKSLNKEVEGFEDEAMNKLINYYWHGNIRELLNVIKRAVLLCSGKYIQTKDLPIEIVNSDKSEEEMSNLPQNDGHNLRSASEIAERQMILKILKKVNFNKTKAAEELSINRKTLYNKLKAYNIEH